MVHRILDDAMIRHLLYRKQVKKTKIIWDTDDLMTAIPEWNPVHHLMKDADLERFQLMASLGDLVTVSTESLAHDLNLQLPHLVAPNLIDLDDWRDGLSHPSDDNQIRILWAGSETHEDDLLTIVPVIRHLIQKYGEKVKFIFMGYMPKDLFLSSICQITYIDLVPVGVYPQTLMRIKPHIGLAPLVDCKFNRCKSNIKYLEYTMAGAVSVCQLNSGAYDQCESSVQPENQDEWIEALEWLISNPSERHDLHRHAWGYVSANLSWQHSQSVQDKWMKIFQDE